MILITYKDIEKTLIDAGLDKGDVVLVHSSLSAPGYIIGGVHSVVEAFMNILGVEGTLVVPTLSQKDFKNSYKNWYMDKPSDTGLFSEYVRKFPGALRSNQETHSVAAIGKKAYEITSGHKDFGPRYGIFGDFAFSWSSPWQKMYDMNAKVLFFGVTMKYNTYKHFVEYRIVEDRVSKIEGIELKNQKLSRIKDFAFFQNNDSRLWPFHDAEKMQIELDKRGLIRKASLGKSRVFCLDIKNMVDSITEILSSDLDKWYDQDMIEWLS